MFAGGIVAFNVNFSCVVRILYYMGTTSIKSCSSVAISEDVLLTAAHCLVEKPDDRIEPSHLKLTVLVKAKEVEFGAKNAYIHPLYKPNYMNDVGLIRADAKLPLKPARLLWSQDSQPLDCMGVGYGARYPEPFNVSILIPVMSTIHYPEGLLLPTTSCVKFKAVVGNSKVICTVHIIGRGPCVGDSGGPMICSGVLRGLLSRGMIISEDEGCGTSRGVLVYEAVNGYQSWIERVVFMSTAAAAAAERNSKDSPALRICTALSLAIYMAYLK